MFIMRTSNRVIQYCLVLEDKTAANNFYKEVSYEENRECFN